MRAGPFLGFLLLAMAVGMWIVASLAFTFDWFRVLRAAGFLLAALALRPNAEAAPRLLGAGLVAAGVADLVGFGRALPYARGAFLWGEGIEALGSVGFLALGAVWLFSGFVGRLGLVRWPALCIGVSAVVLSFLTAAQDAWEWMPGLVTALAGSVVLVVWARDEPSRRRARTTTATS